MIDWNGIGEPTKNLDRRVRVKFRLGDGLTSMIGRLRWTHLGFPSDIVAYEFVDDVSPPALDESKRRKLMPIHAGCMLYFPDALLAVAEHSRKANEKHNPGEPLHWSKHKSNDHANCIGRHLLDAGPNWDGIDPEFGSLHAVALSWRSLAMAQIVIEAARALMTPREYLLKLAEEAE